MASNVRRREVDDFVPSSSASTDRVSTGVETLNTLRHFQKVHHLDPNLPLEDLDNVDAAVESGNAEKGVRVEQTLIEDNSPYPEVRAAVRNYDEDLPANTIRAWVIGLLLCTIGSGVNMLFSLRDPGITITTYVIQLIAYPIGLLWDFIMPDRVWSLFGFKFNLRPGKFNFKEHVIIVVMSNAAYGGGVLRATDIILAQQVWYKQYFGWAWQILLGITTLCTGYGIAGLARRFLVYPAAAIWPADLVNAALFYTLHDHSPSDPHLSGGWSMGRYRWFLIVFAGSFLWFWFPGWLFQGLSWFCWITWIYPNSIVVNQLFGGASGFGLLPISLDWTIISGYLTSPLIFPFHAIANTTAGVLIFFVGLGLGITYTGTWYADYLPVVNSHAYDNTGHSYDVTVILDDNFQFDESKYYAYSPVYLPTHFAIAYGLSFAAVAAVIVHVGLYHGRDIWTQLKLARRQEDDVHMRLMKKYKETPDWWYLLLLITMIGISFAVVCGWDTGFPAWGYVVCIIISLAWTIPIGIIQAMTNTQVGLTVLTEYVAGYMLPGRPLAMMMFKNYGYVSVSQALYFAQDLKLGHYMKVAPRTMFSAQLVASIWSAIVQIVVMNWALGAIPDLCAWDQPDFYTCNNARVFYTASVIWGAIGPARIFSGKGLYASLQWFWLVGAVAPIITWLLARRYPKSVWRYVSMPLVFGGAGLIPSATTYIYLCWGLVGTMFNFFIRRRWTGWWLQYNYVTSAALDCGLIVSTIVVFFSLYMTVMEAPQWYGNIDTLATVDMISRAVQTRVPPGETFGPSSWP